MLVVPISLYVIPSPLHGCLRRYKDAATDASRCRATAVVASLVAHFLLGHQACLSEAAGASWDYVTTVPSSSGRRGPHPLATALSRIPSLAAQHRAVLVRGQEQMGHTRAAPGGFSACRPVAGDQVLVVDDTFASGARALSAAAALHRAGARVVAVVPVGRVINPAHGPHVAAWWAACSTRSYDLGHCCLERDPSPEGRLVNPG